MPGLAALLNFALASWLLLASSPAVALSSSVLVTQYLRDRLQREDGLPQSSVQSIVQTPDGYLWFATQQGLGRYDGKQITTFANWNTPAIRGTDIATLFVDPAGTLWIGLHNHGVTRYRVGHFETVSSVPADAQVWSIAADHKGGVWIGTSGGLYVLRGPDTRVYTAADGLASNIVRAVQLSRDGTVWAGTDRGLNHLSETRIDTFTVRDGLPSNTVRSLFEDSTGTLWVGMLERGVARRVAGRFEALPGLTSPDVFAVAEDRDHNVWIGTAGAGLVRFTNDRLTTLRAREGLANDTVLSIFEDAEGSLWVGCEGGGVTRLKDAKFTTIGASDGLSDDVVSSVYEDARGAIWMATLGSGVNRLQGGRLRTFNTRSGLSNDQVFAVGGDRSGAVWVGTYAGLNRIVGDRITRFGERHGLPAASVGAIYQARDGEMWFGTPRGIARHRNGRFTEVLHADGLPDEFVLCISQDRRGRMLIGTGSGLVRFDGHEFTRLTQRDGLADNTVLEVHEDAQADDVLWVATRQGLSRVAPGNITSFTRANGLVDDLIVGTLEDARGNLWIATNGGLQVVAKSQLHEVADGRRTRLDLISYGVADGLRSTEFNGGLQPSQWHARDGTLWFATVKGAVSIHPERIVSNPRPPPTLIQQIVADGRSFELTDTVALPAGTRRVEVSFAGLSFVAPDAVRYRYRLQGFDRGWMEAGSERRVSFTNLAPGRYRFQVISANNDGVWSPKPASVWLEQRAFFYQTGGFYAACVLAALALAWAWLHWRQRIARAQMRMVLAERSRIARELHDTVAQGLVAVRLQLESAARSAVNDGIVSEHLQRAQQLTANSAEDVRAALVELHAQDADPERLDTALQRFVSNVFDGLATVAHISVSGRARELTPGVHSELLRIGQEAMMNALRHARAARIDVELRFERRHVVLRVHDDGIGTGAELSNSAQPTYGMAGMRARAARIHAQLTVSSSTGQGTEVLVRVPG